ncbi:MAG: carboxylating nicotinate-nucleotide diphosphorylase [Planctomycetaceae bacterium]
MLHFSPPAPTDEELASASRLIDLALTEDLAEAGDITSDTLLPAEAVGTVRLVSRKPGVIAGLPLIAPIFARIDPAIEIELCLQDGAALEPGSVAAMMRGRVRSLLTGERTVLNFLTHLSGIASLTRQFVDRVAGTKAVVLDTRKTLPGYRRLQKYAVRCGGGRNHRMGLYDAILIKDNHLAAWTADGSQTIDAAIRRCRAAVAEHVTVEVEVDTLAQLRVALSANPDIVLLDNMSLPQLRNAVAIRNETAPAVRLEASGGVTLDSVAEIARAGVDRISSGALTHSAGSLDLGFDWGENASAL